VDAQPTLGRGGDTEARQQKGNEGDATPDLLLKNPGETFVTYIWRQMKDLKHTSKTLAEEPETLQKPLQSICTHPDKTLATYV
jgi:hypothetical protein